MHIPDGYLGPQTYVVLDAAMLPVWAIAARRVKSALKAKQIPTLALGAAFSFVVMMFNVPMIGGSTGHAVGATLIAIVLGPWAACIAVSIAVVVQALAFGDGGVTVIGANAFNMAVVMPFVGYAVYRLVGGIEPKGVRRIIAGGVGAYVGIVTAAFVAGVEFGIQPMIAHTASGQPLYSPYPLSVAVPAMTISHALVFGPLEAIVTMGVIAALARAGTPALAEVHVSRSVAWLWGALGLLVLLTPLGLLAPGTSWGEWNAGQLRSSLGYVPAGLAQLGGKWQAALSGYGASRFASARVGYLFSAVVGAALVVAATWLLAKLLAVREAGATRRRSLARRTADSVAGAISEVLDNEEVARRRGVLQLIDPRAKLLGLLLFAVTATLVRSPVVLAAMAAAAIALASASRLDARAFARRLFLSAGLISLFMTAPAATAFVTPGPTLVQLGPVAVTVPGALAVLTLVLRVVACAGVALLVIWTTRWMDLLAAMTSLRVPDVIVATLAMTQKQVVSLMRTVQQLHLARESRTLSFGTAAENRRWVTGRIAFVVSKSLKTADDVHDAMLSRGFTGSVRTLRRDSTGTNAWVQLAVAAAACFVVLGLDRLVTLR